MKKQQTNISTVFLWLWAAWCWVGVVHAQGFYTGNSKIVIQPNTVFSVKGGVNNTGTLVNKGNLKVSASWLNLGTYFPGNGEVTFNGSPGAPAQMISHNGQSIGRIIITGGGKKIITSDLIVDRSIEFTEGVMEEEQNAKLILNAKAAISGGSDRSHVHGAVYQKGAGQKLFPIGDGQLYLPVELLNITDSSAMIGVEEFESDNFLLAKPVSLREISNTRYWHIDVVSGSSENSQVVLPFRDESLPVDPKEIVVAQSPDPSEDFMSIGQSFFEGAASNGRVTSDKMVTMPFVALAAETESVIVHNAVSPNGDGANDFLTITHIENYPENKFSLFSRWGDKLFEVEKYDNEERVFRGRSNIHGDHELVSGTYFYVLDLKGAPTLRGFLSLKN